MPSRIKSLQLQANYHREEREMIRMMNASGYSVQQKFVRNSPEFDLGGPCHVRESVRQLLEKWGGSIKPISPQEFLFNLLRSRGYQAHLIATNDLNQQE